MPRVGNKHYPYTAKGKAAAKAAAKKKGMTAKTGRTIGKTAAAHRAKDKLLKGAKPLMDDPRISDQDIKAVKKDSLWKRSTPSLKTLLNSLKNDVRMSDQDIKTINRIISKTKK